MTKSLPIRSTGVRSISYTATRKPSIRPSFVSSKISSGKYLIYSSRRSLFVFCLLDRLVVDGGMLTSGEVIPFSIFDLTRPNLRVTINDDLATPGRHTDLVT